LLEIIQYVDSVQPPC